MPADGEGARVTSVCVRLCHTVEAPAYMCVCLRLGREPLTSMSPLKAKCVVSRRSGPLTHALTPPCARKGATLPHFSVSGALAYARFVATAPRFVSLLSSRHAWHCDRLPREDADDGKGQQMDDRSNKVLPFCFACFLRAFRRIPFLSPPLLAPRRRCVCACFFLLSGSTARLGSAHLLFSCFLLSS